MQHHSQGLAKGPTAGTTGLLHHDLLHGAVFSADDIERHIARGKQMQAEAIAAMLTAAFRRLGGLVQRRPAGHGAAVGHEPAVPHRA